MLQPWKEDLDESNVSYVKDLPFIFHHSNRHEAMQPLSASQIPLDLRVNIDRQSLHNSFPEPLPFLVAKQNPFPLQLLCTQKILTMVAKTSVKITSVQWNHIPEDDEVVATPGLPGNHIVPIPRMNLKVTLCPDRLVSEAPLHQTFQNILSLPMLSIVLKTQMLSYYASHVEEFERFVLFQSVCKSYHEFLGTQPQMPPSNSTWPSLYYHLDSLRMTEHVIHAIVITWWSWRYMNRLMTTCIFSMEFIRDVQTNSHYRLNVFPDSLMYHFDRHPIIPQTCSPYDMRRWKTFHETPPLDPSVPWTPTPYMMSDMFQKFKRLQLWQAPPYDLDHTALMLGSLLQVEWTMPWEQRLQLTRENEFE